MPGREHETDGGSELAQPLLVACVERCPAPLVEQRHDTERTLSVLADRNAQDAARPVTGPAVHLGVEVGALVRVRQVEGRPRTIDAAGDPAGGGDANLERLAALLLLRD